ncbi:MAG TPA: type IV secretion protein DotH [Rhodospirillaceae bacterium]|nr:type IV secretion protein DotH [Rhodospirillaceae bacterium]
MMKFYLFRIQIVLIMAIFISVCAGAQAQTPSTAVPPDDSETQTLMQDPPPATSSKNQKAKSDAPPSLADYLNNAGVAQVPSTPSTSGAPAPAADGNTVAVPTMEMNALQAGDTVPVAIPDSPEVEKAKSAASIRKEAFGMASDQLMPLKPAEIRRMLEMYDETKQASETPVYPSPEPESSFQTVSLDPGAKPLVIKTAMGNVTTVSIVDVTGQPWPIQDLTWAGDFQIEQPDSGSHMLRIIPTSEFATGNVSMRLVGLNPPVIFSLKAERKTVHVRLDVQIPELGPNGVLPPMDVPVSTKAGDEFMTSILVGVVKGSDTTQLKVDGIDGRTTAYSKGGMVYIRTPYTMLSPAWSSSVQSGDGTKVYALNYSPVILLSDKGKMVRAYLSHKERSDEQY